MASAKAASAATFTICSLSCCPLSALSADFARQQDRFDLGIPGRRAVQSSECNRAVSIWTGELDRSIERDQRLTKVPGIGRNAGIADAEHGMRSMEAVEGRATGARNALVAVRIGYIPKIRTTRTLQHVAAQCRHIADLRTGCELQ